MSKITTTILTYSVERIRKMNEKELEIEKLVKQFEENIKLYFDFIESQEEGQRLIAKMKSTDGSFTRELLLNDFNSLTRKFILIKGKELLDLFKKEMKENLESFFDLFEEERCEEKQRVYMNASDRKTIQLYLMDGDVNGRIKCTIGSWTGVLYNLN